MKQKYYYAIVKISDGDPLLTDGRLHIYWMMKVAKKECEKYTGFKIKRIEIKF